MIRLSGEGGVWFRRLNHVNTSATCKIITLRITIYQWTRKFRQTKGMRVDCIISIVCNMKILIIQWFVISLPRCVENGFLIALLRVYDVNLVGSRLDQVGAKLLHQIGPTGFKLCLFIFVENENFIRARTRTYTENTIYIFI